MAKEIGSSYLNNGAFIDLFMKLKSAALQEVSYNYLFFFSCHLNSNAHSLPSQFGSRKMGDGEVSYAFRERLERNIDGTQAGLKQVNERNKPPPDDDDDDDTLETILGVAGVIAIGSLFG